MDSTSFSKSLTLFQFSHCSRSQLWRVQDILEFTGKYHWRPRPWALQTFSISLLLERSQRDPSDDCSSSKMSLKLCFNYGCDDLRVLLRLEFVIKEIHQLLRRHRRFSIFIRFLKTFASFFSQTIYFWRFCSTSKRAQSNKSSFQIIWKRFFCCSRLSSYRIWNILSCWGMLKMWKWENLLRVLTA